MIGTPGRIRFKQRRRRTVEFWHRQVKENQIGLKHCCLPNGFDPILTFTANRQPILSFEKKSNGLPDVRTIIDNEDILQQRTYPGGWWTVGA